MKPDRPQSPRRAPSPVAKGAAAVQSAHPDRKKGKVDRNWIHSHINDPYVKQAQARGYRSRAAFKLTGIDDDDRLIRPGARVVDLGSAPGSWSQVVVERLGRVDGRLRGHVVAIDLLDMEPVEGVTFIKGDFREQATEDAIAAAMGPGRLDLVLSDMAPNLSGVGVADAARMQDLAELAMDFAARHLKPDGALVMKCFHGSGYSQIIEAAKRRFVSVGPRKPKASRDRSAEIFVVARGLRHSEDRSREPAVPAG